MIDLPSKDALIESDPVGLEEIFINTVSVFFSVWLPSLLGQGCDISMDYLNLSLDWMVYVKFVSKFVKYCWSKRCLKLIMYLFYVAIFLP